MRIGVAILATNAYFLLGLRFVHKWIRYYTGDASIVFHFFSDKNPKEYLNETNNMIIVHHPENHKNWVEGTNSKFKNIITLENEDLDYIYYFDADTDIKHPFTENWFLGDLVGGEHFGNKLWMENNKAFERYEKSRAYIPVDTRLPQMYYYGAFFGGTKFNVINFCRTLKDNQEADRLINFEPGCNDESYINAYFHYNPPSKTVLSQDFAFIISDKAGIGETRMPTLDISEFLQQIKNNKHKNWDVSGNKFYVT